MVRQGTISLLMNGLHHLTQMQSTVLVPPGGYFHAQTQRRMMDDVLRGSGSLEDGVMDMFRGPY